jgi:hypothetical protein
MVNALNAYTQGLQTQSEASRLSQVAENQAGSQDPVAQQDSAAIADTVEISAAGAYELAQAQKAQNAVFDAEVSYYEQFRPTREGFSSRNLALGIVDPGAQPFSQNRPFAEVAQAARENLDSKYQQMRETGEPFGTDNFEGKDWYSLMGDLDRRALHAVASNEGGSFSKEEQSIARDIMIGQQGMAMGLYNGPTRLSGKFTALPPSGNAGHAQMYKAGIQYMDRVSLEEKATSFEWASQRAALQRGYESNAKDSGQVVENFDSGHPLVNLILEAFDAWEHRPGLTSDGNISSKDELLNESWFKGYENRLDGAIEQTRELYGLSQ